MTELWLPSRRSLLKGAAACALFASLPEYSEAAFICFCNAGGTVVQNYPGQAGNPVGFAATPAGAPSKWNAWADGTTFTSTWPGAYSSLTTWAHGTAISNGTGATSGTGTAADPYIFAFYDFIASGTTNASINVNIANVVFVGCRFQSNDLLNHNVNVTTAKVNFYYCSIVPLVSLVPTVPFPGVWPSAGAGQNVNVNSTGAPATYMVNGSDGYEYGLHFTTASVGNTTFDHGDIWGFGNAVVWEDATTLPFIISDTWIHDSANPSPEGYHSDGLGFLNTGSAAPSNITVTHCTIAFLGNTNLFAFQATSTSYSGLTLTNCYCSGDNVPWAIGTRATGTNTNCTFTGNILSTDLLWVNNIVDSPLTSMWSVSNHNNLWRNNTLLVVAGSTYTNPSGGTMLPVWSGASNGLYILPDNSLNSVDWSS